MYDVRRKSILSLTNTHYTIYHIPSVALHSTNSIGYPSFKSFHVEIVSLFVILVDN